MGPQAHKLLDCSCRCLKAAKAGDLQFLQSNVHQNFGPLWLEMITFEAARGNHLQVVQWLSDQQHASQEDGARLGQSICRGAAAGGHLVVLQWA